jgi:predicted Zn-dependent protease
MLEPDNIDFLYGLADYYLKRGLLDNARRVAERMVATHPDNPLGNQILNYIYRNQGK